MFAWKTSAVAIACLLLALTAESQKAGFQPKCPFPFNETPTRTPFDDTCNEGKTKDPGTIAQDVVKDDFCVTGTPVSIDIPTLKQLQADVESPSILGPKYQPPKDRTPLRNLPTRAPDGTYLTEGRLVRLVAYVFEAHYSDTSGGESVNCKIPGNASNDIHMALVSAPNVSDECQSVTTEITPHYRPAAWTDQAFNAVKGVPVRVTGQLFFDASHHPCSGGKPAPPLRQSSWEIHPLYTFEVCKKNSLTACRIDDDTVWESLTEHQKGGTTTTPPPGLKTATVRAQVSHVENDGSALELLTPDGKIQNLAVDSSVTKDAKMLKPGDPAVVDVTSGGGATKIVRLERSAYRPSAGARALALLVALVLLMSATKLLLGKRSAGVLILGVDGRYSNSKFQASLWFGVLLTAYIAAVILRAVGSGGDLIGGIDIPQNLLMLSGLSALTFAGAKAITASKGSDAPTKQGTNAPAATLANTVPTVAVPVTAAPTPARRDPGLATKDPHFPGDLVNDDFGVLSFARYQALIMIIVAVGIFVARSLSYLGSIPLSGATSLPDIDTTVLAALGLGQGAYLTNKLVSPES